MKVKNVPGIKVIDPAKLDDGRHGTAWEYKTITAEREAAGLLQALGEQAWELVSVVPEVGSRVTYFFRRRKYGVHNE